MTTRGKKLKRIAKALTPVLLLALLVHSPAIRADDSYNAICGNILDNPPAASNPNGPANPAADVATQKLQYCQAAKSADDGASADSAMWKVWAAVGVICTYACVASFVGGPTSEYLCMGASVGGGITDAIVTKNLSSALMAIGGAAVGYGINSAMNGGGAAADGATKTASGTSQAGSSGGAAGGGADGAAGGADGASSGSQASGSAGHVTSGESTLADNTVDDTVAKDAVQNGKKTKKDVGACLNAAMAAVQSFMKYKDMQNNQASEQTNLDSAEALHSPAGTAAATTAPTSLANNGNGGGGPNGGGNNQNVGNGSLGGGPSTSTSSSPSACSGMGAGASAGVIMQCAVASDRNLPGFVTNPKFPQEFQKDSGQSLGNFLGNSSGPPSQAMAAASSNGLGSNLASQLASSFDGAAQQLGADVPQAIYAGGGGGGGAEGGGDGMPDMSAMMQGLMDQLNPNNKKKQDTNTGVTAVIFANQHRSPAAVAEDRKLSIFDRVTYRYYFVGRRIVLGEGEK